MKLSVEAECNLIYRNRNRNSCTELSKTVFPVSIVKTVFNNFRWLPGDSPVSKIGPMKSMKSLGSMAGEAKYKQIS